MENFKGVAMDGAKYWQENENNSEWQTDKKHKCSVCGQEADTVLEIKPDEKAECVFACFRSGGKLCMKKALKRVFDENPNAEYVLCRSLTFVKK